MPLIWGRELVLTLPDSCASMVLRCKHPFVLPPAPQVRAPLDWRELGGSPLERGEFLVKLGQRA